MLSVVWITKRFRRHKLSLCCVLILFSRSIFAAEPFEVSHLMDGKPLGLYFETLEDPKGLLKFEDILELNAKSAFHDSLEKVPNYGLSPSTHWVKFSLRNPMTRAVPIMLENKFTFVDRFTLYYQDAQNQWQIKEGGDQIPFSSREIQSRQVVFRFMLEPGTHQFYARTEAEGTHQLPLHIWTPDEFFKHNATEYGFIGILIGFHVVIILYNLFLFYSLKDRTYLVYVVYVASNILYQGAGLGLFQQMFSDLSLFETLSNKVMIVSVDLVAISSLLFSYWFLNIKKRLPRFVWIYGAIGVMDCLNILITLAISVRLGTTLCIVNATLVTSLLIVSGFLIARKGYLPAVFYLVAWGCYLFGVTGTLSNSIGLVPTSIFSRWGQFTGGAFEVAILSLALGARINQRRKKQVKRINQLNTELESKVKQRTSEIQSLLLYIPQGILSISPGGVIGQKYSAQLPDILGHKDIAEQSFKAIILDRSTLSDDYQDQTWQALLATLGESSLNFDLNSDKFPLQITYRFQEFEKVLKLTWNRELNDKLEVERILVTLLDISTEYAAQQELTRQNQEFEIIRQLVELGTKKSIQFFSSSSQLIEENERLVGSGDVSLDTIKILFVNTHTLKGTARSLHLKDLANEFHKVESYYSRILRDRASINRDQIKAEFQAAQMVYQRYEHANRDVLGRKDDLSKISIDREFLQENVKLLRHLSGVAELPCDLREIIHRYKDELTQMIFMSLHSILTELMNQAEKIAKDLGREPPQIEYDVDELLINYSQEQALKNSFIHLLRNALDHGIEPAKNRLESGKAAFGTISLKAYVESASIVIEFKDDGRGLALGRIREKGQRFGAGNPQASPEEVASLVFETGFSTIDTVSLISGRGVGLGAIRQFIEAEGGSVSLVLGRAVDRQREVYEFTVRMTLPSLSIVQQKVLELEKQVS